MQKVRVCMHLRVHTDILLISESITLSSDGMLCEIGLAVIWLMLHCRYVLHKSYLLYDSFSYTSFFSGSFFTDASWRAEYKSTIQSKLEHIHHLKHYKDLQETTVNWNARRSHSDDEAGEVEVLLPPLKKQKTMLTM